MTWKNDWFSHLQRTLAILSMFAGLEIVLFVSYKVIILWGKLIEYWAVQGLTSKNIIHNETRIGSNFSGIFLCNSKYYLMK